MLQIQLQKLHQNTENKTIIECSQILQQNKLTLIFKRVFDIVLSLFLLVLLSLPLLICSLLVALGNDGPVFFMQKRVGQNGKVFNIIKFRTMTVSKSGSEITVNNDKRVTKVGNVLRKFRLDELPQLINVLVGDMSFVGPRPEVPHFVDKYQEDWLATLLVKPGITCESSIYFADEAELLDSADNAEECYINKILPEKCQMNIDYIKNISVVNDVKIMFKTVKRVIS